jgi:ubiquinone/menaquinone biosynthesis C-methylase UbiE
MVAVPGVPEPAVNPAIYDEAYYREWCAGYDEWVASDGKQTSGIYQGFLNRAGLRPGEVVVDVGTGRGELLAVAVERGAKHAYGLEYSPDAVRMAEHTLRQHGVGDRAEVILADARTDALPGGIADLVCMVDVVEHLTVDELDAALRQAYRMLRPGGRVVAHTMPNRLIYDVTYPVLRWTLGLGRWRKNPRLGHELTMHVNEQTLRSLRRAFEQAGFESDVQLGAWVYTDMLPGKRGRRIYQLLARLRPLAQLGIGDLWATGRRA